MSWDTRRQRRRAVDRAQATSAASSVRGTPPTPLHPIVADHTWRRPRRRRAGLRGGRGRLGLRVFLVLIGFLCSGIAGALAYFLPVFSAAVSVTGHHGDLPTERQGQVAGAATGSSSAFTVLLLGSDNDEKFSSGHYLTQSMILVRVDPATKHVVMLSIPRDLWVPIAGGGSAKIDAAYARDGAKTAIATVEEDFHVHVDHYVWTGLNGLIALIDAVGGVDVVASNPVMDDFYPADINSSNPYA